jgi:hypothetical protein
MARRRDEGLAHAPAFGRADGDVLQVGVVAGQPPRHRHRLRVVGVHTAGGRVHHQRQLVGVGALELGQAAVLQDARRQRVVGGQFLQHLFVGAGRAEAVFFFTGRPSLPNRISPICLGLPRLKGWPAMS